jgi:hypothetical protein
MPCHRRDLRLLGSPGHGDVAGQVRWTAPEPFEVSRRSYRKPRTSARSTYLAESPEEAARTR